MKHRFARLAIGGMCLAVLGGGLTPAAASGATINDKKAQAKRLQQEIEANGEQISMLAERYDAAKISLDDATSKIADVEARTVVAQADTDRIQRMVGRRAAAIYMNAGSQTPLDSLNVSSAADAGRRTQYAATTADRDTQVLERLVASRQDLDATKRELEAARERAQSQIDLIEASRRDVEAANSTQARLLSQVNGEIATLIEQEQARQAAAEKARSDAKAARLHLLAARVVARAPARVTTAPSARAAATSTPVGPVGTDPADLAVPDAPASSPGAAAAVAYAKAQLGRPYRYAGVGPDSYDCSGLTMMAWAQAGVSMPHGSIAQGNMFPRVPDNALEPGDLVIYYPDHHHVGMYAGNGMTISATHTGDFVRLQPVFRKGYQFAVRPG
jgi:peptidoglycan DL-endopeptidase CwlO